ncbi:MAG: hypothetical protein IPO08_22680 [Xanthomonadales bacterium]|nr:hypothetical protein [Xanthomonadales bacterium]
MTHEERFEALLQPWGDPPIETDREQARQELLADGWSAAGLIHMTLGGYEDAALLASLEEGRRDEFNSAIEQLAEDGRLLEYIADLAEVEPSATVSDFQVSGTDWP